jgi:hypothetical protein
VTAVEDVLQKLLAKGLKISKCKIGRTSVETLGFHVSYHAIQPSDEQFSRLKLFQLPVVVSRCCDFSVLSRSSGVGSNDARIVRRRRMEFCATRRGIEKIANVRPSTYRTLRLDGRSVNRTPLRKCARRFRIR